MGSVDVRNEANVRSGANNLGDSGVALAPVRSLRECAALLKTAGARAAVLELTQLQAFWLSVMSDRSAPLAQRVACSKLYADSIGGFAAASGAGPGRARVRWGSVEPVEAAVVSDIDY